MKAVVMHAAGGPEVLQIEKNAALPELPGPEYVRVRLYAAGVNPVDYKLRIKGGFFPDRLPAILGCDGAGIVEQVGSGVTRFRPGDAVYFFNGGLGGPEPGNYAEYTIVHQDYLAVKPASLSFTQAAAVPLVLITAWEALFDRARLQAGQSVLIHAGGGGVGHVAVQLARHYGARVAATVSAAKAEFVQKLGADLCIDYRSTDFVNAALDWSGGEGVDVVMDNVGGEVFCRSFGAAKIYGCVVTLLEPPCDQNALKTAKLRNLSLSFELMLTPVLQNIHQARVAQTRMLEQAAQLIDAGQLEVVVSRALPLEQAAEAHRLLEAGHTLGKIVLEIA